MKPLIDFGSEEQKLRLLPRIADGGLASLAITEPEAGSDATGHAHALHAGRRRHHRRRRQDLHHQRRRRRPAAGVRQVERDRRRQGRHLGAGAGAGHARIHHRPAEDKMGLRASSTAALNFDKSRVPRTTCSGTGRRPEDPARLAQQVAAQHRRACARHRHRRLQGHDRLHEHAPAVGPPHRRVPGQPVPARRPRQRAGPVRGLARPRCRPDRAAARPTSASRPRSPSCAPPTSPCA